MVLALIGAACGGDDPGAAVEAVEQSEAGDDSAGSDAFCVEFNSFLAQMVGEWPDDTDPRDTFLGMLDVPGGFRALVDAIGDAPNDEIGSALDISAEAAELIETADLEDPDAFDRIFEFLESPEVVSGTDTIAAYVEANCDIEVDTAAADGAGDDTADGAEATVSDDGPVDDLEVQILASWQSPETGDISAVTAFDGQILVIEELDSFADTELISVDPATGATRTVDDSARVTDIIETASGVFVFDLSECGFRPISPGELSLGAARGDFRDENGGCGTSNQQTVRGDDLWIVRGDRLVVLDSLTGDIRTLPLGDVFDGVNSSSPGFFNTVDLGDAVLVTSSDGEEYSAVRVSDELVPGPVVEVSFPPSLRDGQLFAGSDALDPVTLEVIDQIPGAGDFNANECSNRSAISQETSDGKRWIGPLDTFSDPSEWVIWLCDGTELIAGALLPGRFILPYRSTAADDAYYFVLGKPEPDGFEPESWDLYRVTHEG